MPTLTTAGVAEQIVATLVSQGVVLDDEAVAATEIAGHLTDWLGGQDAVPADLSLKLNGAIGNINADQLQRIDWWTGPANGGPNSDGLYPMTNAAGVTTMFPSLAKIFETVGTVDGDPAAVIAEVEGLVGAAEAARDQVNTAISEWSNVEVLGKVAAPANGSNATAGVFVLANPAVHDGVIKHVRAYVSAGVTIIVRVWSKAGNDFTQVGPDYPVAMTTGLNDKTVAIPIEAGQRIGYYTPSNGIDYDTTTAGDSGGYYATAGNLTAFTDATVTTNVQLQIGFDLEYLVVTKERADAVDTAIEDLQADVVASSAAVAASVTTGFVGRPTTPATGTSGSEGTFAFADPQPHAGVVRVFKAQGHSTGPYGVKLRVFDKAGFDFTQSGVDHDVAVSGATAVAVSIPFEAGQHLGWYAPSGIDYLTATGDSGGLYSSNGNQTSFTDSNGITTTIQYQVSFEVEYFPVTPARVDAIEDTANTAAEDATAALAGVDLLTEVVTVGLPVAVATGSNADATTFVFANPVENAGVLDKVDFWAKSAGTLKLRRFHKVGDLFTQVGSDLAITVGASGAYEYTAEALGSWPVEAGDLIGFYSPLNFIPYTAVAGDSGGYYAGTGDVTTFTDSTVVTSVRLQIGFTFRTVKSFSDSDTGSGDVDLLAAPYVDVSVTGLNLSVDGRIHKNGADLAIVSTVALPAAASGKERLDLIVADRVTGVVSRVAGTERDVNLDAIEFQPVKTAGSVHLATALVGSATAVAVNASQFRGLIKTGREGEMAAHVARNRRYWRRTLAKAERGDPIKLGTNGDSTFAFQDTSLKPATLANQYVANGAWRDLVSYYFTAYPSDTIAAINADIAANGKLGINWAIKRALDDIAGSAAVTYYNYAIGSTTSQATLTGSGTLPNGLYQDRIDVQLAEGLDAITIGYGMNERGQTYTYANIINMIGQYRAEGIECAVVGCMRPNASNSVADWRYTNDALEAAAMDAGAAYISTAMIADDRNLGGIGAPAQCLGATNEATAGNHPGWFEHRQYERAAVLQLGLGQ